MHERGLRREIIKCSHAGPQAGSVAAGGIVPGAASPSARQGRAFHAAKYDEFMRFYQPGGGSSIIFPGGPAAKGGKLLYSAMFVSQRSAPGCLTTKNR